ncbi:probable ubiquitin-conjugating enzyme E2 25 isoform X2 [Tanacetum coccineum]
MTTSVTIFIDFQNVEPNGAEYKDDRYTIFVRVYESRMNLLRAAIIGAEGTPYHDGLFFFDVCFPCTYPQIPPLVHYHSGGLHINPNLYANGKVCLSLLNTWDGDQQEMWIPSSSTMLQVLVSIQGLIFNTKPYFNEPGNEYSSGTVQGKKSALDYNENTLILSLKTMVYTMKKQPKYFEDLVVGHFRHSVRDILTACKAYTEGVQVGSLMRGCVQDVDDGEENCSYKFKTDVVSYIKVLIYAFKSIGAKEDEEFLFLGEKKIHPPKIKPVA